LLAIETEECAPLTIRFFKNKNIGGLNVVVLHQTAKPSENYYSSHLLEGSYEFSFIIYVQQIYVIKYNKIKFIG
jgi:hypothetical protein